MLGDEGNHYRWIFRALALMDRGGIGQRELIEFTIGILDLASLKLHVHHALLWVNLPNAADVAIKDLFVIVIDMLEHFIARGIGPAKALELRSGLGIELLLEGAIEGACADEPAIHGGEYLNIGNRIEAKALRNPFTNDPQDFVIDLFRGGGVDEIKVTLH